jgi:hypothetical protein
VPITLTVTNILSDYYPNFQPGLIVWISGADLGQMSIGAFYAGPGLASPGVATADGVTIENVVVVNSTTITCDFVISQTALIGIRYVAIQTTGGTSTTQALGDTNFHVGFPSDFLVFFG